MCLEIIQSNTCFLKSFRKIWLPSWLVKEVARSCQTGDLWKLWDTCVSPAQHGLFYVEIPLRYATGPTTSHSILPILILKCGLLGLPCRYMGLCALFRATHNSVLLLQKELKELTGTILAFPVACSSHSCHHQQVPDDSIMSCLPGTIRSPWCSCALWSPHWYPGGPGKRVCGTPTSWPPSSAIPSHSTSAGWSTVPPTCMETGPMTSTSALGRTHLSPWVPLVSRGVRANGENGSSDFLNFPKVF